LALPSVSALAAKSAFVADTEVPTTQRMTALTKSVWSAVAAVSAFDDGQAGSSRCIAQKQVGGIYATTKIAAMQDE
jgi:hypothetical protein